MKGDEDLAVRLKTLTPEATTRGRSGAAGPHKPHRVSGDPSDVGRDMCAQHLADSGIVLAEQTRLVVSRDVVAPKREVPDTEDLDGSQLDGRATDPRVTAQGRPPFAASHRQPL